MVIINSQSLGNSGSLTIPYHYQSGLIFRKCLVAGYFPIRKTMLQILPDQMGKAQDQFFWENLQHFFQRQFGTFPKMHQFWCGVGKKWWTIPLGKIGLWPGYLTLSLFFMYDESNTHFQTFIHIWQSAASVLSTTQSTAHRVALIKRIDTSFINIFIQANRYCSITTSAAGTPETAFLTCCFPTKIARVVWSSHLRLVAELQGQPPHPSPNRREENLWVLLQQGPGVKW